MPLFATVCNIGNPRFSLYYRGVGVGVATRTTIWAVGPRLPLLSCSWTETSESPVGNSAVAETKSQNCTDAPGVMIFASPEASVIVHGPEGVKAWNRHAKSLSAFVIV